MDLSRNLRYTLNPKGLISFSNRVPERLLKMKVAIRVFALVVAIAGLASASLAPASNQALSNRSSVRAAGPGPDDSGGGGGLPGPIICQLNGTCFVNSAPSR
jgi:hypothetical protein